MIENHSARILKGLAAGTIGGLVASWVMNEFQYAWIKAANTISPSQNGSNAAENPQSSDQEPATVRAAEAISEKIFGHQLAKDQKHLAGEVVHYATGGGSGAVYGVLAEVAPQVTAGAGIPFGTAVWLVVDEGAVPLLGLSKPPFGYPLSTHIYAYASHLVYGLTTEIVRSVLRRSVLR
jgi:uncharacterized membrane protein YagU involved in acid resistance